MVADDIEPATIKKVSCLSHQSIAFPPPHGVPIPPRFPVVAGQRPSVGEYLPKAAVSLINNENHFGRLDDLSGLGMIVELHETHVIGN